MNLKKLTNISRREKISVPPSRFFFFFSFPLSSFPFFLSSFRLFAFSFFIFLFLFSFPPLASFPQVGLPFPKSAAPVLPHFLLPWFVCFLFVCLFFLVTFSSILYFFFAKKHNFLLKNQYLGNPKILNQSQTLNIEWWLKKKVYSPLFWWWVLSKMRLWKINHCVNHVVPVK